MAQFKNVSSVQQLIYLPSRHVRRDLMGQGRWWDETAPRTVLAPGETVETSIESDLALLRQLTTEKCVQVGMDKKKRSGPLIEIGG